MSKYGIRLEFGQVREYITVSDGFNGSTIDLNPNKIIKADCGAVCLAVLSPGYEGCVRWVSRKEYDKLVFG